MTDLRDLLARYHASRGGTIGETADGVRELSDMFNGLTPRRPGYLAAGRLRRAYVHYYLPVNAEKVRRILTEMDAYAEKTKPPRVLDFGCGPGTAALAMLLHRKVETLTLVDVVDEALDDAKFFCKELGVTPRTMHEPPPGEKFDLVFASNVLTESPTPVEDLIEEDGYLVVIEPALKETTRKLMDWRDEMTVRGFRVAAPCLGVRKCPMLEQPDLWCHMDIPWPRPAMVAEVDRRCGFTKESLKYSYIVLTKTGRGLADLGGDVRIVSNLHKEKGKAWAWTCGREGPLCRAEVLTRHRSETTADFFHADRGDVLKMAVKGPFMRSQGPIEKVL